MAKGVARKVRFRQQHGLCILCGGAMRAHKDHQKYEPEHASIEHLIPQSQVPFAEHVNAWWNKAASHLGCNHDRGSNPLNLAQRARVAVLHYRIEQEHKERLAKIQWELVPAFKIDRVRAELNAGPIPSYAQEYFSLEC